MDPEELARLFAQQDATSEFANASKGSEGSLAEFLLGAGRTAATFLPVIGELDSANESRKAFAEGRPGAGSLFGVLTALGLGELSGPMKSILKESMTNAARQSVRMKRGHEAHTLRGLNTPIAMRSSDELARFNQPLEKMMMDLNDSDDLNDYIVAMADLDHHLASSDLTRLDNIHRELDAISQWRLENQGIGSIERARLTDAAYVMLDKTERHIGQRVRSMSDEAFEEAYNKPVTRGGLSIAGWTTVDGINDVRTLREMSDEVFEDWLHAKNMRIEENENFVFNLPLS